jgi:hypothetical protein
VNYRRKSSKSKILRASFNSSRERSLSRRKKLKAKKMTKIGLKRSMKKLWIR